jgi:hypothetical protein
MKVLERYRIVDLDDEQCIGLYMRERIKLNDALQLRWLLTRSGRLLDVDQFILQLKLEMRQSSG